MTDLAAVVAERDALLEELADIAHESRNSTDIGRKYWLLWRDVRAEMRSVTGERDRARATAARLEAELHITDAALAAHDTWSKPPA